MSTSKLYRRIIKLEILSDRPIDTDDLAALAYEVTQGDASGSILSDATEEVTPELMRVLLIEQGSDPAFLLGDEEA